MTPRAKPGFLRGPPPPRRSRGGKRELTSPVRCWCGRLGVVGRHAPSFRCVRRRKIAPDPAAPWSPFSGVPLTESTEFKAFVARRREERAKRAAGGA